MGDGGREVGVAPCECASERSFVAACVADRLLPPQNGKRFFDITEHPTLGALRARSAFKKKAVFPEKPKLQKEVKPLLANLSKTEMKDHLTTFTSFHTRYYKVRIALLTRYISHANPHPTVRLRPAVQRVAPRPGP